MNTVNGIDIEALGGGEAVRLELGGAARLRGLGAVRSAGRGRSNRRSGPADDPRPAAIQGCTAAACLMPATQLVEVELEISPDESRNNEKKLEGESDASPH
jgi:hypothetical protein